MKKDRSPTMACLSLCFSLLLATILFAGLAQTMANARPAHAGLERESDAAVAQAASNMVITIGVAADLSGPLQQWGWPQLNAVQLAVDEVNAAGGLSIGGDSYTLTVASADSMCSSSEAITAANWLLDAGAVAVVGHTCSSASLAAQALYAAAAVPMVTASSTLPELTEQGYTTTFRVVWREDLPQRLLANHLVNALGYDRAAIVELEAWGATGPAINVFADAFADLGGTVTSRHTISTTDQFTATLTAIVSESPELIHFAHPDPVVAALLSEVAHNLGMADVTVAWTPFGDRSSLASYASAAGAAAEGDIALLHGREPAAMPGYDLLDAAYQAAGFANYGDEVGSWGAFAYDAAQIIIAAIEQANSLDPAAIQGALAAMNNHEGVVGLYRGFDSQGDVIPQWAWLERFQDGEWVLVGPHWLFLPVIVR